MAHSTIRNSLTGNEWYPDFFARFYDLIYHQVRDSVDNTFYLDRIMETRGKILEVGVGTGRLFSQALEKKADIFGIDISPAMVDILKKKIDPQHHSRISLRNIIDFKSDNEFDLVIAPFRVFMHLIEKEDQIMALNNVCKNLKRGGSFIFDLFVPDLKMLINGLDNIVDFDGEYEPGKRVKRIVSTKPDVMNQIINILFRFEWNDEKDKYSGEWNSRLRYFHRYELEHLLDRSDFTDYDIRGDFEGGVLSQGSKEFIITCCK
jgi:SAM-dependent methyltransferase